jgi:hypothetical protein
LTGLIDDVAVWDEVLDGAQINNVFTSGAANYNIPEPSSICLLAIGLLGLIALRRRR